MKWLNYHHLMYFREIANEKSVSRAATKLCLGQPALSGQLKTLEKQLGQPLFERKNRTLILTEAGKFALQRANEIHHAGSLLLEVMDKGVMTSKINLKIGALDSVPKHLTLNLIAEAQEIQDCQVTIVEGRADDLLRELQAHALDFLILNYHAPISDRGGVFSRPLARAPIVVFGAPKFRHLKHGFPKSLHGQRFMLPTLSNKLRHDIEHYFRINDLLLEIFVETQDTSIQKMLGMEGYGLVALPEFSAKEHVSDKKLMRLGEMQGVYEEYWLISAKRSIENPVASKLIKEFKFSF